MAHSSKEIVDLNKKFHEKASFAASIKVVVKELKEIAKNHPDRKEDCEELIKLLMSMIRQNMAGGRKKK